METPVSFQSFKNINFYKNLIFLNISIFDIQILINFQLNFEELHSGGNNTCEVNPEEPGRDSGYGTDNAHRSSTPTSAINSIHRDQEILTGKYRSLDEFDKPLFVIAHGYIFDGYIDFTDNEEHRKIYGEGEIF